MAQDAVGEYHTWKIRMEPTNKPKDGSGKKKVGYDPAQLLSGRGVYQVHLYRSRYDDSPYCPTCNMIANDMEQDLNC